MDSSLAKLPSSLRSSIFSSSDLKAHPAINAALTDLINSTFHQAKAANPSLWDPSQIRPRFPSPSSLTTMLGQAGLCAVIFDSINGTEVPVATASIIPNDNAELVGSYWDEGNLPLEFELRAVVTHPSPRYRAHGLATYCCTLLTSTISSLLQTSASSTHPSSPPSTSSPSPPCKTFRLRLHAAQAESGAYWQRRGFQETHRHSLPIGMGGCKQERTIVSMMRHVPLSPGNGGVAGLSEAEVEKLRGLLGPYFMGRTLREEAVGREPGRVTVATRVGPESTRNQDLATTAALEALRESCRNMLRGSG
ncbi:hypothetical protein BU16DRAFT_622950 [Lophium mytilinum]|uniref:Uncharacterized protein n=1 Tax=Lophium mytilinum TaxID=390894 RepID=A0A6A6QCP0_9PEZI|nr:hypothetical protein BU16DRAFT_622950 [Lophium mytilinum]